jgi:hypothetical protein
VSLGVFRAPLQLKEWYNNDTTGRWLQNTYPLPGALLPYNRIIAFTEIYIPQGWES